ncbi:hypothetical protein GCM10007905_02160 [Mixta theicola]|nr:hypothetical protein GCM10007905_02160 [Mixta theicola]
MKKLYLNDIEYISGVAAGGGYAEFRAVIRSVIENRFKGWKHPLNLSAARDITVV